MRKKAVIIATIILSLGIVGFVWAAPGDSWEINLSGNLTPTSSIDVVPFNNNTDNLGVFGSAWNNLFVSSTAFLNDVQVGGGSGDAILSVYEAPLNTDRMFHFGPDDSEFSADVKSNYLDITNSVIGYYNNLEAGAGVYNGLSVVAENDRAGDIYGFQAFSAEAISSQASGNKGLVQAGFFQPAHHGAGTVGALTALSLYPLSLSGSGLVTDVYGLQVSPAISGSATNVYRVKIEEGDSAGTIDNSYGLYIDELSGNGDVLNYSIYVDGPKDENFPFVVEANGNVGIGTDFPSSALQILEGDFEVGSGLVTTTLYQDGSASFGGDVLANSNSALNLGAYKNAWKDVFVSGTAYVSSISGENGNVGIGTSNPQRPLHVSGGSDAYSDVIFNNSWVGETATDGLQVGFLAGDAYIWNYEASKIIIATNDNVRGNIMSDGLWIIGNGTLDGTLATATGDLLVSSNLEVDSTALLQGLVYVCDGACGASTYATLPGEIYVEGDLEAGGILAVGNNLYVGRDSSADDDYVFFDANTENIWWDESENRFKISDALIPSGGHKVAGYDLGKSTTNAWDNLYYDDAFNQGAPDWSQANVLDKIRAFKPRPKAPGTFDAVKEEAGMSELDPGSLPIELTGYHQQKAEYENWTPFRQDEEGNILKDEQGNNISNGDRPNNPDTRPVEEYGIWTNGMVSFNYQAIGEILDKVEKLELENQKLVERIEDLENR